MNVDAQSKEQAEILREIAEDRARSLPPKASDLLFERIERAIEEEKKNERPRLRLLPGGAGITMTVLAAAAAIVLMYGRPAPAPVEHAEVTSPRGSEVVEVDFGSNAGTHFTVEGERGQRLAVVWIDDWELR